MRLQFSLLGMFLFLTWACLTICTLCTTDFYFGRFLSGVVFMAAHFLAIVMVAVSARLRKPAIVFMAVATGHVLLTYRGREIYPLLDFAYQLVRWLDLPNTPRGLGDYVTKGVLASSMMLGLLASWLTRACLAHSDE
jgi:hypothetical protein